MDIYEAGVNPALSLYKFWHDYLRAIHGDLGPNRSSKSRQRLLAAIGTHRDWMIGTHLHDRKGRPVIELGKRESWGEFAPYFRLTASGRFQFAGPMWGTHRRNAIADNTFLEYGFAASRYQWLAAPHRDPSKGYHYGFPYSLNDYTKPFTYYSEGLLGAHRWSELRPWVVLEPQGEGWVLAPARDQTNVGLRKRSRGSGYEYDNWRMHVRIASRRYFTLRAEWKRQDVVRERRYQRLEDSGRERRNLPPKRRGATLLDGDQVLRGSEAALRLAALLDVNAPARTTPLKSRPKEAQHHGNDMDSAYQL